MNKAAPIFADDEKLWKKPALKKLLYSLDWQKYYAEDFHRKMIFQAAEQIFGIVFSSA
jgi:hypothetical protein